MRDTVENKVEEGEEDEEGEVVGGVRIVEEKWKFQVAMLRV